MLLHPIYQNAVRLERRFDVEQIVHALERDTLGLWDKEETGFD